MQRAPQLSPSVIMLALLSALTPSLGCGVEGARQDGTAGVGGSSAAGAAAGQSASGTGAGGLPSAGVGGQSSTPAQGGGANAPGGAASSSGGSDAGSAGQAGAAPLLGPPAIYVGGFGSEPVLRYQLDPSTGALTPQGNPVAAGPEPSCLALDPARTHLYVCNEDDGNGGGATAFAIGADGALTRLNHRTGSDLGLTSLAVSPNGKWLAGAAYTGGSASLFSLEPDGSLGQEVGFADFGDDAQAHCVTFDPSGEFLLVPTKGSSAVQQLLIGENGSLTPNSPPAVAAEPSSGPRHSVVHPNGKLAFVINEAGSSITTYQLSPEGKLTRAATIPSLPSDFAGSNTGAHIELSPDARFLYVSNRGHDSIGAFALDADTGALTLIEFEPSRGSAPYDFDIDQTGKLLAVVNRKASTLAVFAIALDGSLSALAQPLATRSDPTAVLIHYPK